jgi:hypothetical protein
MPALDILPLEGREEAAEEGQHVIGDVVRLGAPDKQRRTCVPVHVGIPEGKAAQVVEVFGKNIERDAEFSLAAWTITGIGGRYEVGKEELADLGRLQNIG